jgi:hypothetical protein
VGDDDGSGEVGGLAAVEPGEYFFPPLASLATAGARLLLALLERLISDAGGSWAFADTDSMAIVSTEHGGHVPCPGGPLRDPQGRASVRALSWAQVDQIIDRFQQLSPYTGEHGPRSILELEDENFESGTRRQLYCYAISAKRYCLFTLDQAGEPTTIKALEHALGGFYLNPTDPDSDDRDWVGEAWEWILRTDGLDRPADEPAWLDRPALTRFTASHPRLLKPLEALNRGKAYIEQIKPANFLLVAHVAPGGYPQGADPERFALIAPYETDPQAIDQLRWRNVYDPNGPDHRISSETLISRRGHPLPRGTVGVRSYRDILTAYRTHPEAKSIGPRRPTLHARHHRSTQPPPRPSPLDHRRRQRSQPSRRDPSRTDRRRRRSPHRVPRHQA